MSRSRAKRAFTQVRTIGDWTRYGRDTNKGGFDGRESPNENFYALYVISEIGVVGELLGPFVKQNVPIMHKPSVGRIAGRHAVGTWNSPDETFTRKNKDVIKKASRIYCRNKLLRSVMLVALKLQFDALLCQRNIFTNFCFLINGDVHVRESAI